jgi:hypothetical protein
LALQEWRSRGPRGGTPWQRHALVEAVLAEIGRRYLDEQDELDAYYRLYAVM